MTTNDEPDGLSRADRFLAHVDELVGDAESGEDTVPSSMPGLPDVIAIDYEDAPEEGLLLGVTYGLSLASFEDWREYRPELSICLESDDPAWVLALAQLVDDERGDAEFAIGEVFDLGEPVVEGSEMTGFVIAGPLVFDGDAAVVEVGEDLPIRILGAYPIHGSEGVFIEREGIEAFWALDWDPYDPDRPAAV